MDTSQIESILNQIDFVRVGIVLVLVVAVAYGGFALFISGDGDNGEETNVLENADFNVEFSDNSVSVSQTDGELIGEGLTATLVYEDGSEDTEALQYESLNEDVSISYNQDASDVSHIEINWVDEDGDEQSLHTEQIPAEFDVEPVELSGLDNRQLTTDDNIQINAEEYIEGDTTVVEYTWELGDGTVVNDALLDHSYDNGGQYTVDLTVVDSEGNEDMTSFQVIVDEPDVPLLEFDESFTVNEGEELELSANDYVNEEVTTYQWEMGDGTTYDSESITHTYDSPGTFTIELTVGEGEESETDSAQIQVEEVEQEIDILLSETELEEEGHYEFNVEEYEEYDSNATEFEWNFGDDNIETTNESTITHQYEEEGNYEVIVGVTFEDGSEDSDFVVIDVEFGTDEDESDEDEGSDEEETDFDDEEADVQIQLDNRGEVAWQVEGIEGAEVDEILRDDELGDDNPTLYLQEDVRYEFVGIPDTDQYSYDFELRNVVGQTLLSQHEESPYEDDNEVAWVDETDTVRFTVAGEFADELDGYRAATTDKEGSIVVE